MNKPFARFEENTFGIYRTKIGVIVAVCLVGAILVATGVALAFLLGPSQENKILTYSGYGLLVLVVLFFYDILDIFRLVQGKTDATFLEANPLRLTVNPALFPYPTYYEWRHVDEIYPVELFYANEVGGEKALENQIVIFFKSGIGLDETMVGNRKCQRLVSPQGRLYTLVPFPPGLSVEDIASALKSASNNNVKIFPQKDLRFEGKVLQMAK